MMAGNLRVSSSPHWGLTRQAHIFGPLRAVAQEAVCPGNLLLAQPLAARNALSMVLHTVPVLARRTHSGCCMRPLCMLSSQPSGCLALQPMSRPASTTCTRLPDVCCHNHYTPVTTYRQATAVSHATAVLIYCPGLPGARTRAAGGCGAASCDPGGGRSLSQSCAVACAQPNLRMPLPDMRHQWCFTDCLGQSCRAFQSQSFHAFATQVASMVLHAVPVLARRTRWGCWMMWGCKLWPWRRSPI